jgi:hypothetical protein
MTPDVEKLIAWLKRRGDPDSGIRYEAGSHSNTRGIRHSLARVELHGSDADFIAKHFHGAGARQLADALASLVRERDEARGQRDELRLLVRECANADFIASALARSK